MQEGLRKLEILLDPYDWFCEVVAEARRYVVYVTQMDASQDTIIPDWMHGKQVVVHFASNAPDAKNNFVNKVSARLPAYTPFGKHEELVVLTAEDVKLFQATGGFPKVEPNIKALTDELDRLEKQCGSNILGDVFFEIRDGHNAVTNLSARFPEVRQSLQKLYDKYGFDALYSELEL
jgi:hypothetical protein